MVFTTGIGRPCNVAMGEDKPGILWHMFPGVLDQAVLAGTRGTDNIEKLSHADNSPYKPARHYATCDLPEANHRVW